jgi:hypothetical protein
MDGELEQLGERIAEQAAHLDAAMHRMLTDLREFDQRGGWHRQGALSCAHWLAWRVGWSLVTARDRVRVANKLADFSLIDDALRRGEVSYSKVRAMLRVATPVNESLLLEYARLMTGSQLENTCRKYALVLRGGQDPNPRDDEQRRYVRRRDTDDGMIKIEAVLHPEEAEMVWTMLNHAATRLTNGPDKTQGSDSAESRIAVSPCTSVVDPQRCTAPGDTAPAPRSSGATVSRIDDSAESSAAVPGAIIETDWEVDASRSRVGGATRNDSAESCADGVGQDAEVEESTPVKSLLDRLLDEEDALRAAQAMPPIEDETSAAEVWPQYENARREGAQREVSALRQRVDAARRAFDRADALVSLAQRYLRGARPNRSPVEITITIPRASLAGEAADPVEVGEMSSSFLSREAVRRLSCDAGIIEVVEDDRGTPLSVGRKKRTIAGALKRALHQRDTTCTFPGCTHRIFLEGHHIKHWADGGETSLQNTTLLCTSHHRFVHEYGYTIEMTGDQGPQFRDPRGRLVQAVPERPHVADGGWPRLRAMNEPLAIDASTVACEWDGTPVDYGSIVGHLAFADRLH